MLTKRIPFRNILHYFGSAFVYLSFRWLFRFNPKLPFVVLATRQLFIMYYVLTRGNNECHLTVITYMRKTYIISLNGPAKSCDPFIISCGTMWSDKENTRDDLEINIEHCFGLPYFLCSKDSPIENPVSISWHFITFHHKLTRRNT